jgi:hypothetical protein
MAVQHFSKMMDERYRRFCFGEIQASEMRHFWRECTRMRKMAYHENEKRDFDDDAHALERGKYLC